MNWLADLSERGLEKSYGLMVNYKYDLNQIEHNNRQYIMDGTIAISDDFRSLIE